MTVTLIISGSTKPSQFQRMASEQYLKEITLTVVLGQFRAFVYEYGNFFQNKISAVKIEQLKSQKVLAAAFI